MHIPDELTVLWNATPGSPLLFHTLPFAIFLVIVLALQALLAKRPALRITTLILISFYFYWLGTGAFVLTLAVSTLFNFACGQAIDFSKSRAAKRTWVTIGIATNVAAIGFFKYANFFLSTAMELQHAPFTPLDIFIPIGISFFTFQAIGYLIDVYRGTISASQSLWEFAGFLTLFPQLLSGPISRFAEVRQQLIRRLHITREEIGEAVLLLITGLFKKAIVADYIGINFVDRVFDDPARYTGLENLFAVYGYAIQVYCDFSGYTDLALGVALLLGFRLRVNFNSPYQAASVSEFWRRWHISLSSWLQEYLYLPIINRVLRIVRKFGWERAESEVRVAYPIAAISTMLIGGLWHGAAWKFVIWGGWHGILLSLENVVRLPLRRSKSKAVRALKILFTFHLVALGWLWFRATNMESAWVMLQRIGGEFHPELLLAVISGYWTVITLIIITAIFQFTPERLSSAALRLAVQSPWYIKSVALAIAIVGVATVRTSQPQPFLYLQF